VADHLREVAPDVRPSVWTDRHYRWQKFLLATRPTFAFSPLPPKQFLLPRGVVACGANLSKSEEYAALERAGIPVPRYRVLTEENPKPADLKELGEYVVLKPDRGGRGAKIRIVRSGRAKWEPVETKIGGQSEALVAQEFIYTGKWPVSFRVTTLYGQVLWSLRQEADRSRTPLAGSDGDAFKKAGGVTVVSNSKGCTMQLNFDAEVIAFAERAHAAALPEVPLLGIDVIRDALTGRLYVVELNSVGRGVAFFVAPGAAGAAGIRVRPRRTVRRAAQGRDDPRGQGAATRRLSDSDRSFNGPDQANGLSRRPTLQLPPGTQPGVRVKLIELRRRWLDRFGGLGTPAVQDELFEKLVHAYCAPDRHYHDASHITDCLKEFDAVRGMAHDPAALEAAIFYHDIVYDGHRSDNEERSAEAAAEALGRLGATNRFIDGVRKLILFTRHDLEPDSEDGKLMVDIDLASLALPPEKFDENSRKIRMEYQHVPEAAFVAARNDMLGGLLARPRIYYTDVFFQKYEQAGA
jgi:predicted metal-dependent HD superfamily phosphohydrolase